MNKKMLNTCNRDNFKKERMLRSKSIFKHDNSLPPPKVPQNTLYNPSSEM